jgi:hypothetical protein
MATGRVVFTQDKDFLRLHAGSVEHCGIAFCYQLAVALVKSSEVCFSSGRFTSPRKCPIESSSSRRSALVRSINHPVSSS